MSVERIGQLSQAKTPEGEPSGSSFFMPAGYRRQIIPLEDLPAAVQTVNRLANQYGEALYLRAELPGVVLAYVPESDP